MEPITLMVNELKDHGCEVLSNHDVKGLGNYCYIVVNPDGCEALMQYHPYGELIELVFDSFSYISIDLHALSWGFFKASSIKLKAKPDEKTDLNTVFYQVADLYENYHTTKFKNIRKKV
ncbi:hypothetical protein FC52_GL000885 [Lactobacillus pasteurii DSM 23907 = CRBIP 24.76]|uniref:Uncharacterized protein n=1 Tax=Lactobacillus pasteurii DSM 23907 = CRBIP 24.76 TaxID=1423790 RepID=I7IZU0_9LACO|nr:hypothetical protein [Lactobacillus pasteurii]KRK07223.1 hypothetical protein FC52_GL000885 [Lactobacillus pasteurii DSM 23907 = CRBIP 24.76]TDG76590.1 hypothetical protein C5L33_001349 [Lactobacillus pasteurii]CCI85317.1 Protein of unknown function [Lactobacillus pasteurii DSM 23907 = CRBIP 24.76]